MFVHLDTTETEGRETERVRERERDRKTYGERVCVREFV